MVRLIYSFFIFCYGLLLRFAALVSPKARQWHEGRRGIFGKIRTALNSHDHARTPIIWFHASSLGEFEQGRPVVEAFRKRWPRKKILLTFFSPSGYEVRKNYDQADWVFYLPLDLPGNARMFLDIVQPEMVFFIKYDFWFNYLKSIHDHKIPLYFISAVFRENQYFFRWYGRWFCRHLRFVSCFFVQNRESEKLLKSFGIKDVQVTGDTRFDRVFTISAQKSTMPLIEKFCAGKPVFIAGSCWEPDEEVFLPLLNRKGPDLKFIIAPHDTSPGRIRYIREHVDKPMVCYSELNNDNASGAEVLLIDSVGILAQLYRYATVAFIGGGFGHGIHNIQEPVTFGVPVLFGPNYHKFREAVELVEQGGAFSSASSADLIKKIIEITGNPQEHDRIASVCLKYVEANRGATEKVMKYLER
jgi:3-deoxy-D-manno-octulosonic-acid transferase